MRLHLVERQHIRGSWFRASCKKKSWMWQTWRMPRIGSFTSHSSIFSSFIFFCTVVAAKLKSPFLRFLCISCSCRCNLGPANQAQLLEIWYGKEILAKRSWMPRMHWLAWAEAGKQDPMVSSINSFLYWLQQLYRHLWISLGLGDQKLWKLSALFQPFKGYTPSILIYPFLFQLAGVDYTDCN